MRLHLTATRLFLPVPAIDYVGQGDNWKKNCPDRNDPLLALATLHELHYRERKQAIRDQLLGSFSGDPDRVRVISEERLASAYSPYLRTMPRADSKCVAERSAEMFPDGQVLLFELAIHLHERQQFPIGARMP